MKLYIFTCAGMEETVRQLVGESDGSIDAEELRRLVIDEHGEYHAVELELDEADILSFFLTAYVFKVEDGVMSRYEVLPES